MQGDHAALEDLEAFGQLDQIAGYGEATPAAERDQPAGLFSPCAVGQSPALRLHYVSCDLRMAVQCHADPCGHVVHPSGVSPAALAAT